MELVWLMAIIVIGAFVTGIVGILVRFLRASRAERRFNEYLVCLMLHELGDARDSSLPLSHLVDILPVHPDETRETLAYLRYAQLIETYLDGDESRVRLGPRTLKLFESGGWRRALPFEERQMFEYQIRMAKHKLSAA